MKDLENKPIRVVLADDHPVVRTGIRQILERASDIQVIAEAVDGDEAQARIEEFLPDVAVLDIQMPKRSGIEVTRWIRAHHRDIGILVLTAFDDDPYIFAILRAGANGYVLKTASPDEISQAVRDVYTGKSVLDPAITEKVMAQILNQTTAPAVEALTGRELEVLTLAAQGYTNKAIGIHLGISDRTVQGHLAKIFDKLQASSRTEAVMRAVSLGWLPTDLGEQEKDEP